MKNQFIHLNNRLQITILFCIVLAAYSNTFFASWHLDDYTNIIQNSRLHLDDLSFGSIAKTFYAYPEATGKLYRPVSCLTLALNWYFGKNNVVGYHIFNLSAHLVAAFFLFLTIHLILTTPNLKKRYQQSACFMAFASTALWALNPIQTQAVTYIVQRMAVLAAMFYILSIYFYLKARAANHRKEKFLFFIGCFLSFIFAIGSKENAVVLPITLFLLEIICFQNISISGKKNWLLRFSVMAALIIIVMIVIAFVLMFKKNLFGVAGFSEMRPFTPFQRLLTQFRVLVFYLSQIFFPIPQRLSIDHNIHISTSICQPWTTLPSFLIVITLIATGALLIRKSPLISLAMLFFFINHIVESTVLPLELVFEHRNYLPTMFVFLPVTAGFKHLYDHYRGENNKLISDALFGFILFLTVFLSVGTYIRNMAWKSERTLWEAAIQKAPNSARSAYSLANYYFNRAGGLDFAMALYRKSLELDDVNPTLSSAQALNGIAGIYYIRNDYENAVLYGQKAVDADPKNEALRYSFTLSLIKNKEFNRALNNLDIFLLNNPDNVAGLILKGIVLNDLQKPEQAVYFFKRALRLAPQDARIMLSMGNAFNLLGNFRQADWFFRQSTRLAPDDLNQWFCLIENSISSGNRTLSQLYLDQLFSRFPVAVIFDQIMSLEQNRSDIPVTAVYVERKKLAPVISKYLESRTKTF